MNTLSRELGVTTTADIGLLSIEFTCFDGDQCYTQSLCLTNTGVNTSRLNRLEHFVNDFDREGKFMTGEELHSHLDEIERIHGLYSPTALGFAAALACGCFTFLLGGGPIEMLFAFAAQASATLSLQADKTPFHSVSGHHGFSLFGKPRVCCPAEAG